MNMPSRTALLCTLAVASMAMLASHPGRAEPRAESCAARQAQQRPCTCPLTIRSHGVVCRWVACGQVIAGTHRSRCGYRCPGRLGVVWSGSQTVP